MRDAEVHEIREVVGRQQHVLRLDVAVDQAICVRGVQSRRHLRDDRRRPPRLQRAVRPQLVLQAGAVDQAHVDVQRPVDVAEVVHGDDVRFLQPCRHPGLPPETLLIALVCGHLRTQHLHRHHPFLDGVIRAIDLAHTADTDQGAQLIRPELRAQPRSILRGGHS